MMKKVDIGSYIKMWEDVYIYGILSQDLWSRHQTDTNGVRNFISYRKTAESKKKENIARECS